jgi:hypothetical protein
MIMHYAASFVPDLERPNPDLPRTEPNEPTSEEMPTRVRQDGKKEEQRLEREQQGPTRQASIQADLAHVIEPGGLRSTEVTESFHYGPVMRFDTSSVVTRSLQQSKSQEVQAIGTPRNG